MQKILGRYTASVKDSAQADPRLVLVQSNRTAADIVMDTNTLSALLRDLNNIEGRIIGHPELQSELAKAFVSARGMDKILSALARQRGIISN